MMLSPRFTSTGRDNWHCPSEWHRHDARWHGKTMLARDWRRRWAPRLDRATRIVALVGVGIVLAMAAMQSGLLP
ncbi:hypothetical protein [Sphingosinithalassobacter portus]|uniref:hypothetical protein n=1 Tax=Stakelama portus TaxID=2676234 RepID=UPI0011AB3A5A|nr:hypothetical protein [Sphingosinithalassobacter portus]